MKIEYEKIQNRKPVTPALIRRLLLAWLIAAAVEFLLLPDGAATMNGLQALSAMSFPRLLIVTGAVMALLEGISRLLPHRMERWLLVGIYAILASAALAATFTWAP